MYSFIHYDNLEEYLYSDDPINRELAQWYMQTDEYKEADKEWWDKAAKECIAIELKNKGITNDVDIDPKVIDALTHSLLGVCVRMIQENGKNKLMLFNDLK